MSATSTAPLRRRQPAAPARRHLRVVDRVPRRHPVVFLVLYLLVAAAVVLGAVSLNALAASDAIAVRELSNELTADQRDYDRLVAEVAGLEDPARIQRLAEEMGMVPATSARHVSPRQELDVDDGVTGEAGMADDRVKSAIGVQG